MGWSLNDELGKLTQKLTGNVAEKAKESAITTLKDPEFKAAVNQFTKDWAYENRFVLGPVVLGFLILSVLAVVNILSNLRAK